jgi:hypothetical protein
LKVLADQRLHLERNMRTSTEIGTILAAGNFILKCDTAGEADRPMPHSAEVIQFSNRTARNGSRFAGRLSPIPPNT